MIHMLRCGAIKKSGRVGRYSKGGAKMAVEALELFVMIVQSAIPYAVVFALGNIVVRTFMRMAFGGKVEF